MTELIETAKEIDRVAPDFGLNRTAPAQGYESYKQFVRTAPVAPAGARRSETYIKINTYARVLRVRVFFLTEKVSAFRLLVAASPASPPPRLGLGGAGRHSEAFAFV